VVFSVGAIVLKISAEHTPGAFMQRPSSSPRFPVGSALPAFTLPATDGSSISSTSWFAGAHAALIVFSCNHCPYVKGSDQELLEVSHRFAEAGLRVLVISSNDAAQYPEDSFAKMREKAISLAFPFPYLYDETQEVARQFDAQCTPECYLFNEEMKLAFHGAINDSPRGPEKVTKHLIRDAVEQVLRQGSVELSFAHPLGCSIKWKG
jgi:peroxiredoxin